MRYKGSDSLWNGVAAHVSRDRLPGGIDLGPQARYFAFGVIFSWRNQGGFLVVL
jgi:hypothetical protein